MLQLLSVQSTRTRQLNLSAQLFFFFFTGIPDDSAPAVNETGLRSR